MRDTLFLYYVEFGHGLCYKRRYAISARRIKNLYSGFLMLASAGSIAALAVWKELPLLWSVIAVTAQTMQVLQPLTQAAKQQEALKYILQDASRIFDEIASYWDLVGSREIRPEEYQNVADKISEFKSRMRESEERFASDLHFPRKPWLIKPASRDNQEYFWYHYNVKPEGGTFYG